MYKVIFEVTGRKQRINGTTRWPIYFQIVDRWDTWKFWQWEWYIRGLSDV